MEAPTPIVSLAKTEFTPIHKPMGQWQHFKCQFNGELLQTTHPSPSNNLIGHIGFISLVITSLLQGPCMYV